MYLGAQYCDRCPNDWTMQSTWVVDHPKNGGRPAVLCRAHFEQETGNPPPKFKTAEDLKGHDQ